MSIVGGYAPAGATVQETSTTERGGAVQGRRHVSKIPRQYRASLFRHAAGLAPHHRAANAAQLLHLLHGSKTPSHVPAKHDERNHPHQHQQQKQKQPQQNQHAHQHRQQKPRASSAPHHAQRGPHHPARTLRWQIAHAGRNLPNARQDAPGRWPDGRDGNREQQRAGAAKQRSRAITRIRGVGRTELQTVAARTHDQPLVYADTMREAVIRQRCAGHDAHAVTEDVLKARTLAHDYAKTAYDDLQSFLRDFLRISAGTGASGALTPLVAFHDLRPSSPKLLERSLSQHGALGMSRWRLAGSAAADDGASDGGTNRGATHAPADDADAQAGASRARGSGPTS